MMVIFIAPAVQATAPSGAAVMGHLVTKMKLPTVLNHSAWLSTLAGLVLYGRLYVQAGSAYFGTTAGIFLSVGALAGVFAFIGAVFIQLPRSKRIAMMGGQAGPNPSPEQAAAIGAEQEKFAFGGKIVVGFFVISLLGMLLSHPM